MPQYSKAGRTAEQHRTQAPPPGINYLLVIAIDDYKHCAPLQNCVSDAQDVVKELAAKYNFEKVVQLTNQEATYENIIEKLEELSKQIKKDVDNLVLYFSGHGDTEGDAENQIGYLVPVDARKGKVRDYIPHSFFKEKLNLIPTRHTFVIIDACFSGSFFSNIRGNADGAEHLPSRWGISSTKSREFALDGTLGDNSPFAKCLIETLQENDDRLSPHGLAAKIEQKMKDQGVSQEPICKPFLNHKKYKDGMFFFHPIQNNTQIWATTEATDTAAAYHAFWQKYPDHANAEEALWRYACKQNEVNAFQFYRNTFFGGKYFEAALDKIDDLVFEQAKDKGIDQLRDYLKRFGYNANHAKKAHQLIDALLSGISLKTPTPATTAVSTPSADSSVQSFGTFTDPRDKQTYKTVELNGLVWMAENLNYDLGEKSLCYQNDKLLGKEYGRLYNWNVAMEEACPPGWRLPTDKEWRDLIVPHGGYFDNLINPDGVEKGNDLPKAFFTVKELLHIKEGGGYKDHNFGNFHIASYWSADKRDLGNRINYNFIKETKAIYRTESGRLNALSVRCVRDTKLDTNAKLILPKEELITDPPRLPFEPEMVFVQGGTFNMGSNDYDSEKPIHEVTVKDFYIGKYPVTQAEWRAVMGSDPPNLSFKGCDQCPVERVSWDDVQEFIKKLNNQSGKNYRLPTEAEWEYATRGGSKSNNYKYAGSNTIGEVAWYTKNSENKTHPVGQKKANELSIYDMSGNVREWCEDVWHANYDGAPKDGSAWRSGGDQDRRVVRGGSWVFNGDGCRVSNRDRKYAGYRVNLIGFRLAGY